MNNTAHHPDEPGAIRLAHFSDIHVSAAGAWRLRDFFNKRMSAWLNLRLLGRGHSFRHTDRVLGTHYPVWLADGKRERYSHALRDVDAVVAVCRRGGISLWLHGHRHDAYYRPGSDDAPFPVVCAGSATQAGCWSYTEYTLSG